MWPHLPIKPYDVLYVRKSTFWLAKSGDNLIIAGPVLSYARMQSCAADT